MTEQLARVIRTLALPMTSQALADLALKADQDRRAALAAGNAQRAAELDAEVQDLTSLLDQQRSQRIARDSHAAMEHRRKINDA